MLYRATRELLWNNVNLIEMVTSLTELNFMIKSSDALRGYSALESLLAAAKKAGK